MNRLAWIVTGALLVLPAGCDRGAAPADPSSGSSTPDRSAEGPRGAGLNVLLITVDTTRADSFACYGHPEVRTPNIDRLASQGTLFEQCISSIPITLPSHTSMMTGSYQFVHGVRDNGFFYVAQENVTLAEQFKELGYTTEALVAAPVLDAKYGLDQGFDYYDQMGTALWVEQLQAKQAERARENEASDAPEMPAPVAEDDEDFEYLYRPAADMLEIILPRLEGVRDKPFFMWTHFFDPHLPDLSPPEFREQYSDQYFAEIAYFDHYLGKLLDKLDELNLTEKTLVILTSDHGESRGQHGEHTHSYFIYDATQRVPLIMRLPGKVPAGARVATQVRLIDLAPTVRELVGLPETPQNQGVSLWPVLDDPLRDLELSAYADTLTGQFSFGFAPLRFVRDGGWKYVHSPDPELYNVAEDDLELVNLIRSEPDRAAAMKAALRQLIAESPEPPAGRASSQAVDSIDLARLEALGYISSGDEEITAAFAEGSELDHFEPVGENPRKHLELIELNVITMGAINKQDFPVAEQMCRRLLELDPDNPQHLKRLGDVILAQERHEEALETFRRALALAPQDKNIRSVLGPIGWILLRQGDNEEALEHFRLAQKNNPEEFRPYLGSAAIHLAEEDYAAAAAAYESAAERIPFDPFTWVRMAMAYKFAGDLEKAEERLRYVLEREPQMTEARLQLGNVLERAGREAEATEQFEQAAREADEPGRAYRLLGVLHSNQRDHEAARDAFEQAIAADPDNADGHYNLGTTQIRLSRPDEAIESFRRATEINPAFGQAWYGLARTLQNNGRIAESIPPARQAVVLLPTSASAYRVLADSLEATGDPAGAIATLQAGAEAGVRAPLLLNDLAWRLATAARDDLRRPREALQLALESLEKSGQQKRNALDTVAAAYAAVGQFQEAVLAVRQAIVLAEQAGLDAQAARMRSRLELYQREQAYRVSE